MVGVIEQRHDLLDTAAQVRPDASRVLSVAVVRQTRLVVHIASLEVIDGVKVVEGEGRRRPVAADQRVEAVDTERSEAIDRSRLVK